MMLTQAETRTLRELAKRYMDVARSDGQARTRALWVRLNDRPMARPMVLIDQICWEEFSDESLVNQVNEPYFRQIETELRRAIYQMAHFPVDRVLPDCILLPRPVENTGWGVDPRCDTIKHGVNEALSRRFIRTVAGPEDVPKIQIPRLILHRDAEKEILETAREVFDGVAPVKLRGIQIHLGVWDTISQWLNVENCYLEIMDRPEFIHAVMERMTEGLLSMIEDGNRQGLFDVTSHLCHCSHTFASDLPGKRVDETNAQSSDAWSFGLAQLFTSVSPAVTEEFEAAYMRRVFPKFGAIYYGCCDRLDDRLDVIATLPKVRKISCSPWSDRERFAANLPSRCVMSNKPNPAYLATDVFHGELVRDDLRRTIRAAKAHDTALEFILKDISTLRGDPARLDQWGKIAMEEVQRA